MMVLRDLMVRMARMRRSSCQIAVDRGIHMMMQYTLPTLFSDLSHERPLAWHVAHQAMAPAAGIDFDRSGVWQPLPIDTGLGRLLPHVRVSGAVRPGRPLVIWHHGAGEFPVDAAVNNVWTCGGFDLPLALVRATSHHTYRSYARQMTTSDGAASLLASSALAMEHIRRRWDGPVIIGGLSLGGMVALLHARIWGRTALAAGHPLRWVSYAAGPDIAAVIKRSGFRRLACNHTVRNRQLGRLLDLDQHPFDPVVARRIHPLLAQWDQVHCLRDQAAAYRRAGIRPGVVGRGHIGLSVDGVAIAGHLRGVLDHLERDAAVRPDAA